MERGVNILVESGVDGYNVQEQRRMGTERAAAVVVYEYQRKIGELCKSSHNSDSAAPEKVVRRRTFIEITSAVELFNVTDLQHNRLNLFVSSDLAFYLEPLFAESQLKHEYKHELCCNKRAKT